MNSGLLDLKTRRNVSLVPVDVGVERGAALVRGEAKALEPTKAAETAVSKIPEASRIERVTEVLIVSIRCVKQVFALRFAWGLRPAATHVASRGTSRLGGCSAGAPAPPANGKAPQPTRRRHRRAPASRSWTAMREPSTASAACRHGRILRRRPSLRAGSS